MNTLNLENKKMTLYCLEEN